MKERAAFSPALMIGLIVAGLLSFAAFVLLLAYGGDGGVRNRERATAVSRSAIGFHALFDLTGRLHPVELLRQGGLLDTPDLVVVSLEATNTREEVEALLRRRANLPTLLILPKWLVRADPDRRGWVRSLGPFHGGEAARLLGNVTAEQIRIGPRSRPAPGEGLLHGVTVPLPPITQVVRGQDIEPLIDTPQGAVVARWRDRPHFIVADPDLMNNHGLRDPRVAEAAVQMLLQFHPNYEEDVIRFDLTLNGVDSGGNSLLRAMFEPPFLALTLALVAAALLAGYHGAVRFGPARRPVRAIPFGKAALVENSAGLVRLAGRDVRLGGAYADVVRDDAARAGGAPPTLRDADLDAYLDRFTRPGQASFTALAHAVRTARDRGELLAAARALFAWKKDMIR
jgi:hypothetical protein